MKTNIETNKASRLINCGMVIMVSCGYQDKRTITPCAWHMPVSKEPTIISIALAKKHFSSELIRKSKEFAVNVPDWKLLDKMGKCGKVSGRNVDKFNQASVEIMSPTYFAFRDGQDSTIPKFDLPKNGSGKGKRLSKERMSINPYREKTQPLGSRS